MISRLSFSLALKPGDAQERFQHLWARELRAAFQQRGGTAHTTDDGGFEAETVARLPDGDEGIVTFILRQDADGTLAQLTADCEGTAEEVPLLKDACQSLVSRVLALAVANKLEKHFCRDQFLYVGPALDGEYWLPGFRLGPANPSDEAKPVRNYERVIHIDQSTAGLDVADARSLARESANGIAARLSFILNTALYRPEPVSLWVYEQLADSTHAARRLQRGIPEGPPALTQMPDKGQLSPLGAYCEPLLDSRTEITALLKVPGDARAILRASALGSAVFRQAFDRCARLYQVALTNDSRYPSVGLTYRVAAAEAIAKTDPKYGHFADFMRKHLADNPEVNEVIERLYGRIRSSHIHTGEFPIGEFAREHFTRWNDRRHFDCLWLAMRGNQLIGAAIRDWLKANVTLASADDVSST